MEILRGENLSFKYAGGEGNAISDVSFSINEGELIVVMGESGCGKTTLLKLIKKEMIPAGEKRGSIYYKQTKIEDMDERTSVADIGFVMQKVEAQIVTDKVYHELAFVLESLSYKTEEIRIKVGEMASYFGIQGLFRKKTDELSGGEKQLLNLASVMVTSPKILILDEPTSQLDPIAASDFIATLKKLNKELGLTIILVEHRLEEVFSIADRIMVMEKGKLVSFDTPSNTGKFLSSHKMLAGAPKAVVLYKEMKGIGGECPVNVKEGREYILKNFDNEIRAVKDYDIKAEASNGTGDIEENAIELKNVWFRYHKEEKDILRGINLTVKRGEVFTLLGGNGTGKSTTLSIISGLRKHYRGKVLINGRKIKDFKRNELYRENLSLLPQDPVTVFVKSEVYSDYADILKAHEIKNNIDERINEVAEMLGISKLLHKHPYDLSGGEQQKCAIGKILLIMPKIILLDEPTKGIDGCGKEELINIVRLLKDKGITVVIVTHDVEFAADVSDSCGLLFDGEILAKALPKEFFARNNFYTTAVNRMTRDIYENVITLKELVWIIKENMKNQKIKI